MKADFHRGLLSNVNYVSWDCKNVHTMKKIYSMGELAWGGKETLPVVVICMLVKKEFDIRKR
jgi:hypothetical protein